MQPLYLSPSSAASAHAGSGHGTDDFSSTNTYTSGAEESDYSNHNGISLDDFGLDSTHDDEDEDEFTKTNSNEFHGSDIQRDSEYHDGLSDDDYIDYHEENSYLLAEMPTSFCVCNFSSCQMPACAEGFYPVLVRNGTGTPGSCCDIYECKVLEGEYPIVNTPSSLFTQHSLV